MCDSRSSESPQVKLVLEWGKGFETKDINVLGKCLHDDFRSITYPRSLGLPDRDKVQWLERMKMVMSLWTEGCNVNITPIQVPYAHPTKLFPVGRYPLHHRGSGEGRPPRSFVLNLDQIDCLPHLLNRDARCYLYT